MKRLLLLLTCSLLILYSCSPKNPTGNDNRFLLKNFKSFELSYSDGWIKDFSFAVDSNRMCILAMEDTVKYGMLPDSLFRMIDTALFLVQDRSYKATGINCYDCPVVAVLAFCGEDTLHFLEDHNGQLYNTFRPVVNSIENFSRNPNLKSRNGTILFETKNWILPVPPPPPPKVPHR